MNNKLPLAIVIPVYRAADSIERVIDEVFADLRDVLEEVFLVVDGSPDESSAVCKRIAASNPRVKSIILRRNFGEHNAVMCGLNFVSAPYVAIMDDDAQHPPTEILKLLAEIEKGYDVVYGIYEKKEHHWFRNLGSKFTNLVATLLINKPSDLYLSSFKILRTDLLPSVTNYRGPFPYLDGLVLRATIQLVHARWCTGSVNRAL